MVAGIGDKMLSMAAQHGDIIAIAAQGHLDQLGERIDYVKNHAGPRFEQIEFAFSFFQLSFNKTPDLTLLRSTSPKSTDEELMQSVTLLQGSVLQAAERIAELREQFGISYFTLNLSPGTTWEDLEKLLATAR
jgi:alkanesulfonate monooxygenase SsuD/methylene tetrahydromethanopterin reductase-like flavin-dependent oxidoreductase (luciferase family)